MVAKRKTSFTLNREEEKSFDMVMDCLTDMLDNLSPYDQEHEWDRAYEALTALKRVLSMPCIDFVELDD